MAVDRARLELALRNANAAGDTAAAQQLATELRRQTAQSAPAAPSPMAEAAPESPTSARNLAGAAVEPLLAMGGSAAGSILGGLSGLGTYAETALGFDVGDPDTNVRWWQDLLGYQPRTVGGQNAMKVFSAPGDLLHRGAQWIGNRVLQETGSPELATAYHTAAEGLPTILGLRGGAGAGTVLQRSTPTVGNLIRRAAGKPTKPAVDPAVRELSRRNITMTPGDIKGGMVRGIEDRVAGLPVLGEPIKAARSRAVEGFQRATLNDALRHIKQELPKDATGHAAVTRTGELFDQAYDDVLGRMRGDLDAGGGPPTAVATPGATPGTPGAGVQPRSLRTELTQIEAMARSGLPPRQAGIIRRFIQQDIINKFTVGGRAAGRTVQEIHENLRNRIDEYKRSNVPEDRQVSRALMEAQAAVDRMLERVNPSVAPEYQAVRRGYAMFKIAEDAAGRIGAREGVPTAAQYRSAVRAADRSKGKRRFARGTARQQSLAEAGQKVLGDRTPDSGTAGRELVANALMGGSGIAGATLGHPGFLAGAAAAPVLYSDPVLSALQPWLLGDRSLVPAAAATLPVGALQSGAQQP